MPHQVAEPEPVVLALGSWGLRVPQPPEPVHLSATSVLLFLRGSLHPDHRAAPVTYGIELEDRTLTLRTQNGRIYIEPGEPPHPDATLRTDPATLNSLLSDPWGAPRFSDSGYNLST